ncbi:hypothetical protein LJ737_08415 [Hymenobacter sp. 15J16-1T3B]|uniref:hypothetical protein n=1 Tax=Hymenobacter sp. 15J16-1T3B TaxID=2886941 RepID=UPI001D0F7E33|nr:hypothetical protein [Hymenobacter sp. 15J16-1T3B]MCC3157259.1 hypothetical protein [Hymenobacter sp. 15J16-1T3B]
MTAAFRLPRRRQEYLGFLLVLLSLVPLGVAFHQVVVLLFDLFDPSTTALRYLRLAADVVGAGVIGGQLFYQGLRRIDR